MSMSGGRHWRAIGLGAALSLALLTAILAAGSYAAIEGRWFRPPYGSIGKDLAWTLGVPEGAYNFDIVIPGRLYRSALPDARLIGYLRDTYGVERLVSLAGSFDSHDAAQDLDIDVSVFHWQGHALPPREELERVLDIIDEGVPVLVHCVHGQNRAGYTVAAYRVLRQKWTGEAAMGEMARHGYIPHSDGNQQLQRAVEKLLGAL